MTATIPTHYGALASYLRNHLRAEQEALDAYQRVIDDHPDDDIISYLIRMILDDESRHHKLFTEILNSLDSKIRWEDISPRVPPQRMPIYDRDELLATTNHLLELERTDAKELKRLRKAWARDGGEFGLWAVLVKSAELDTEKHIHILRYLRRLITESSAAG